MKGGAIFSRPLMNVPEPNGHVSPTLSELTAPPMTTHQRGRQGGDHPTFALRWLSRRLRPSYPITASADGRTSIR
ncbi:transaldolase total (iss); phenazine biosynthesis phzc [Trichuris trichiura]|uniref:Transaldolase total (Iss) phenazine biosynthesis phzc n=1 Tax=Trichuris trichiura TaxID=36087 RepID=A0A077ZGL5_TRITR|nr:transaldolase total (iss); phenazine biosynthesis phzc [Trichuris trichiura]